MDPIIRAARPGDHADVLAFTTDTFPWGDYAGAAFPEWLEDPDGRIMVAEVDGRVVAMARAVMVGPIEAWAQAMRVHPHFRRRGLGTAVSGALWDWAARRGARVVRLLTEGWNEPAAAMVAADGFRPVSQWVMAQRGVGENSPVPEGNGGRRVTPAEALRPAPRGDEDAALMAWSAWGVEQASRGLGAFRWTWRRFARGDLVAASRDRALWTGRPGWAIAYVEDEYLLVDWVVTTDDDARSMCLALVDVASRAGAEMLEVKVPATEWMVRELRHIGCEISPLVVHAKTL